MNIHAILTQMNSNFVQDTHKYVLQILRGRSFRAFNFTGRVQILSFSSICCWFPDCHVALDTDIY